MELTSQRRQRINPRAMVGKVLLFNAIIDIIVGVLLGAITLFSQAGTTSTHGNGISITGLLALIFAGVGLLEGLVGLVLWLLPGGVSPAASLVNQYYAALENQDYARAFQCLDPYMGGPLGRTVTQAEFIERAQAYDAEHGRVTHYALRGVRANPSMRVYTIKVTRRSGAYRNRLRLAGQGYNWKIVSFDRF